LDNYNYFGYLKGANEVNGLLSASSTIMLAKSTIMQGYAARIVPKFMLA